MAPKSHATTAASAPRRSTFARTVALSMATVAGTIVLAFGNSILLARVTGPEGRGLYALGVAILALTAPLLSLGLGTAATYVIGRLGRDREMSGLIHAWTVAIALGSVLAIGGAIATEIELTSPLSTALLAALATLPAAVYLDGVRGLCIGRGCTTRYNLVYAAPVVVLFLLNLATLSWGPGWVLVNLVASYWVAGVLGLVLELRRGRMEIPTPALARLGLGYGVRATGIAIVDAALLRLDWLLMMPFVALGDMGLYAVADQIVGAIAACGLAAARMLHGESSRDASGDGARKKLRASLRVLVVFTAAEGGLAIVTGWWLVPCVFGEAFTMAWVAIALLAPSAALRVAASLFSTYLAGRAIQTPILRTTALAALVQAGLVLYAAPTLGWLGVAAVKTLTMVLQLALVWAVYRRHHAGDIR